MDASDGLDFNAGVQLGLHQDHMVGSREIQSRGTLPHAHADEEHGG